MSQLTHRMQRRGRWLRLLPVLLGSLLALALAGCFTMLKHPVSPGAASSAYTGSCLDCHDGDADVVPSSYPWVDYYGSSHNPWINYYGSPWWYDSSWRPYGARLEGGAEPVEQPTRVLGHWGWGHRRQLEATGGETHRRENGGLPDLTFPAPPSRLPTSAPRPAGAPAAEEQKETPEAKDKEEDEKQAKKKDQPQKPNPRSYGASS